jgi:hypothetical protein
MEIRWHTCAGRLPVRTVMMCLFVSSNRKNLISREGNFLFSFFSRFFFFFFFFFFDAKAICFRGRTRRAFARFSDPLSLSLSLVYRRLAFLITREKKICRLILSSSLCETNSRARAQNATQVRRIRRTKEARSSSTFTSRIRTRSNLRR